MSSPQGSGTLRGVADEARQLGVVGDRERDIVAAAAAGRAAVCLDGEVSIGKQPDVERGQAEPLTAAGVGPPLCFRDVTLIASAVTSTRFPLLMTAMVPRPTHRSVPSFRN